jgi:hypothetical protein
VAGFDDVARALVHASLDALLRGTRHYGRIPSARRLDAMQVAYYRRVDATYQVQGPVDTCRLRS